MRKTGSALLTLFLLYTLGFGLPAFASSQQVVVPPPIVIPPNIEPGQITDITDVVAYLQAHPDLGAAQASYLLSWIKPYHPIPETIIQIDPITVNTVTAAEHETGLYALPTIVSAKTNLGNTIQVPVTWRDNDNAIATEASTAIAGTYTYYGEVEGYYGNALFILTVTDPDMYRIVLSWNEHPWDLDSHLFGQNTDGNQQFHVYYGVTEYVYGGETVAALERDITSGYGPETTSIYFDSHDWDYKFGVHKYSGNGTLATSNATVSLYRGDVLLDTYHVSDAVPASQSSTGNELYWNIFEIIDGELREVMTLDDQWTASFPLFGQNQGI